jgi:DNA-3-methyladenine glycosylase
VARDLLGCTLVVDHGEGEMRVRLVETEAYIGEHDRASHAARGRTQRNAAMYGPPGHAYIYFIYGMYERLNVVTGPAGDPQAVLVRGAEPLAGVDGRLDGPGRLTRSLGIDRSLFGHRLTDPPMYLTWGPPPGEIVATPRIGVDYAAEWAEAPLRFCDAASAHVSRR